MRRGNFEGMASHCKVWEQSVVIRSKMAELIQMLFMLWAQGIVLDGVKISHGRGNFWGKGRPLQSICRELQKNGSTKRFAIWVVDLGGPKEAQVQSYLPGGTHMGGLAPPGEYN